MMIEEQIKAFLRSGDIPDNPDLESLRELTLKYPYFQGLLFLYLKSLYVANGTNFQPELNRLSPFITDRKALFYCIFKEEYSLFFEKTGKQELPEDRTGDLLHAFFEQVNVSTDKDKVLEQNILTSGIVSVDYFSFLEKATGEKVEDAQPESTQQKGKENSLPDSSIRHQQIIDSFIEKSDNGEDFKIRLKPDDNTSDSDEEISPPVENDSLDDSMFFTETLSRIYIKQKKYKEAYKIIKELGLNYPEKNVYFADQIRFLEKLIINSSNNK